MDSSSAPVRPGQPHDEPTARILRRLMLALLVFTMVFSLLDLIFYRHYEDLWQTIPLVALALATLALAGHLTLKSRVAARAFQSAMLLLILCGALGILLHAQGSAEFHSETAPAASRWQLAMTVLHSKVPPTLAPGVMVQMGLLGLAATYRHPALRKNKGENQ